MTARIPSVDASFDLPDSVVTELRKGDDASVSDLIDDTSSATRASLNSTIGAQTGFMNVKSYGAVGDGVTDDSSAVSSALAAADGSTVFFPAGTYLITDITLPARTVLQLDPEAVLSHKSGNGLPMFSTATGFVSFRMRGGTVNGNRSTIEGRPRIIVAEIPSGTRMDIEEVTFTSTVAAVVRVTNFGGYFNFSRNRVIDQAQHSGVDGESTVVVTIVNGQEDVKGVIRTNRNWHFFDDTILSDGSNPGGYFVCTSPDVGGGPTPDGNLSTWEADGNYFYGYGQFGGPGTGTNDISPLHTYPTVAGARWTNNYFEKCGYCAMSAKSVQDFVCTGNVVMNGLTSTRNIAVEGAIDYAPGYHAGSIVRPRATIANNIVDNPGGEPTMPQTCIAVKGTSTSYATDVILSGNVLSGDGVGIGVVDVTNLMLTSNIIRIGDGAPTDEGVGIALANVEGKVMISGNSVATVNGDDLTATNGCESAELILSGNAFYDTREGSGVNILIRGVTAFKGTGNRIVKGSGEAINVAATSAGTKVGFFAWDESNTIEGGTTSIAWGDISKASGNLTDVGSPDGQVVPADVGMIYRQTDTDTGSSALWQSVGTTADDWVPLSNVVTTPSIVYGTNSNGEPLNRIADGARTSGQIPVYRSGGDLLVANTPGTTASATSKAYVDDAIATAIAGLS